jgi:hypothetical protein
VNRADANGNTALHFGNSSSFYYILLSLSLFLSLMKGLSFLEAALACNHQAVDLLVEEGAQISRVNLRARNPLDELLTNCKRERNRYRETNALIDRTVKENEREKKDLKKHGKFS